MLTYAYRCTKCDHEFEAFEKITKVPGPKRCPLCGKRAERVITGGAGFLFKGEGFYVTDYRSQEYRQKAEAEKEPAAGAKEEPKPEAKTPAEKRRKPRKGGKGG